MPTQNLKQALPTHNSVPTPRPKPTHVKAPGPNRNEKKNHLTSSRTRKELPTLFQVQASEPMPTHKKLPTLNQKSEQRKLKQTHPTNCQPLQTNNQELPTPTSMPTPEFLPTQALSLPECEQEQHQQQHTCLTKRTVKCNHSPTHETTPRKKRKLEGGTEWREEGEGGISTLIKKWGKREKKKIQMR